MAPAQPFTLYVHWPFCRRICPYCDFNVRRHRPKMIDDMVQALVADLRAEGVWRQQHSAQGQLRAIHFGGGTPSMMPARAIEEILFTAHDLFDCAESLEVALEANPEDYASFGDLHRSGVNRLTLGIQALDDRRLAQLGRGHNRAIALRAIDVARQELTNVAGDFIYATSNQTLGQWQRELEDIVGLGLDHVSLYALTIEPNTIFGKRPPTGLPSDDHSADLMVMGEQACEQAGYPQYEVSNFAPEARRSVYNSGVWRCWDFVGIGPGASGRHLDHHHRRHARRKQVNPQTYLRAALGAGGDLEVLCAEQERLGFRSAMQEWLLMNLRLCEGVDLSRPPIFVPRFTPDMTWIQTALQDWCDAHLLRIDASRLVPTAKGRLQLDRLIAAVYRTLEPAL